MNQWWQGVTHKAIWINHELFLNIKRLLRTGKEKKKGHPFKHWRKLWEKTEFTKNSRVKHKFYWVKVAYGNEIKNIWDIKLQGWHCRAYPESSTLSSSNQCQGKMWGEQMRPLNEEEAMTAHNRDEEPICNSKSEDWMKSQRERKPRKSINKKNLD